MERLHVSGNFITRTNNQNALKNYALIVRFVFHILNLQNLSKLFSSSRNQND